MGLHPGVGDAAIHQPGVQLLVALRPHARREEPLAHDADLVLDLALLPAGRRRAGDGLDEVVPAHLQKAAVVAPLAADEHRVHRRLHVVVDPARAGALEEREGPVVRVEHHLLALARIGAHEQHPAVAEPDVGHLRDGRDAVDQHHLVAPVELVALARREAQRHEGRRRRRVLPPRPVHREAPNRVVAARVAQPPQLLENPHQRQPLPPRPTCVTGEDPVEPLPPRPDLRLRLDVPLVHERRLVAPDDLAHRIARDVQLPGRSP